MSVRRRVALSFGILAILVSLPGLAQQQYPNCARTIRANVSAIDQPFLVNRMGAWMVEGMVYALDRDIVPITNSNCTGAGCPQFQLREGKRPRPLVLRANIGDCLAIQFTNRLTDVPAPYNKGVQPATRTASIHVAGMQVVATIDHDGSYVGVNGSSLVAPGQKKTYVLRATAEGTFLLNSEGAPWGGLNLPNDGAQVTAGLFGAVNVQPKEAIWLKSQLTREDMLKAVDTTKGNAGFTPLGQPILDFESPVLNMLQGDELVCTDLTAIIAGPKRNGYQFLDDDDPNTRPVPFEPKRKRPFREFTIEYHELNDAQQAFPIFDYKNASLTNTLQAAGDAFAINYGSGGIGAEILANRFGLGPMNSCVDCKFEEFFLSSWTVGDPAMVVDFPANSPCSGTTFTSDPAVTNSGAPAANCTEGVKGNAPAGVTPLRKATKTLYPDDPSNVYHSYINDRVIFRTLHAGTGVSHVHHLHAHQWFHSPNTAGSTYLDSQLINPGSAYTMEIAHLGSGNLNKVVGDSIFHCHFYPHFGAGMWAMWRSHDVFEMGTELDSSGRPKPGWNRAQPDGEIAAGTPIPALVPMPSLPMAPMPARVRIVPVADPNATTPNSPVVGYRAETNPEDLAKGLNPGYPFFIPGVAGTRAPHPPKDFAVLDGKTLDGGLPRYMMINANVETESHNYVNFEKDLDYINAYQLPEEGTDVEKVAMDFHARCTHDTFLTDGTPGKYRTNGRPPVSGAPYADPGVKSESDSDTCTPVTDWINYRAAVVQTDFVINKLGWHYPQSRLLTLWEDVLPTVSGKKPPEPFFFRGNAKTGVNYWHTNLVPNYYLMDDYQVRTPTDIIGQHIHLVKFDVTSSDGAANGFNYEDGTLSYQEVQTTIDGINECGGLAADLMSIKKCAKVDADKCVDGSGRKCLKAEAPPKQICPDPMKMPCAGWFGAQTTVQRWYSDHIDDEESDLANGERTLRTVFTHDHFGPSTHQQTGLYAAFLVEPANSKWYLNDKAKTRMGTRSDGGPTSWEAIIETPGTDKRNTYREFAIAIQDFQFAYWGNSPYRPTSFSGTQTDKDGNTSTVSGGLSWASPTTSIEPPAIQGAGVAGPQIISAGPTAGTTSFNYRNEPLPYRVQGATGDPDTPWSKATDLSYVFASNVERNLQILNEQPVPGSAVGTSGFRFPGKELTPGMEGGDPYTPLLRAYEGDRVQVRVIVGAHMLPHDFTIHGIKWLFEPSWWDSGYRSNQSMGISEHFEYIFDVPRASPSKDSKHKWADYLYMPDMSNARHGIVDGTWGLFRAYQGKRSDLPVLSTNATPAAVPATTRKGGYGCPQDAPMRKFTVEATAPGASMTFNSRGVGTGQRFPEPIVNPFPMLYTFKSSTAPGGTATPAVPNTTEPLILRANAGECVELTLRNAMDPSFPVFANTSTAAFAPEIPLAPSYVAGITPALMSYDVMNSSGMNIGFNPEQTADFKKEKTYYWYAGQTNVSAGGTVKGTPIEFGPVNLTPSDPMEQDLHGLVGGLIVEPPGSIACYDIYNPQPSPVARPMYASATIYDGGDCKNPGKLRYREFAMLTQDDLANLTWPQQCYCGNPQTGTTPNPDTCEPCNSVIQWAVTPQTSGFGLNSAINYRTEPMQYRFNATTFVNRTDVWRGFSDAFVLNEPQTPIFSAARNTPVRFHLLHPGGSGNQQVMALHGHVWQELPYVDKSTRIGDNKLSMWLGARDNYGANTAYSIILEGNGGAGGQDGVMGDYIYRTTPANFLTQGLWGIFRVGKSGSDTVSLSAAQFTSGGLWVAGSSTVYLDDKANPQNGQRAPTVTLSILKRGTADNSECGGATGTGTQLATPFVGDNGLWNYNPRTIPVTSPSDYCIVAVSPYGGRDEMRISLALEPGGQEEASVPDPVGEGIRFVNTPRAREGRNRTVDPGKPEAGLAAPPTPGVPQATPVNPNPNKPKP